MAVTLAAASSARGELTLRRLDDGRLELRANGVFVMDDRESTSERALATLALAAVRDLDPGDGPLRMLVGGLGLGQTAAAVLASPIVGSVVVAEIESALVGWADVGLLGPVAAGVLADRRVEVVVADVRDVLGTQHDLDAILLDVDNGPNGLVHISNAGLYGPDGLALCRAALRATGVLLIWSAAPSPTLLRTAEALFDTVVEHSFPVRLDTRDETYAVYEARG